MAIYDFFLSRNSSPVITAETYIGHRGRLFYDDETGELRISDGETPGGFPIPITLASTTTAGSVKLGPGVVLNTEGQIIIDSTGLDFSFGDFESLIGTYPAEHPREGDDFAILKTRNDNQDAVFASNGTGSIKVVGEFEIYKPDNGLTDALLEKPFFKVQTDGQIKIMVPTPDPLEGAVEIIGSESGGSISPAVAGVMLHVTGNQDSFASIYADGIGGHGAFVGRRYNGTAEDPTPVLSGQTISRFVAAGYTDTGFPSAGPGSIQIDAIEDYVDGKQGAEIKFLTAPLGGTVRTVVARINNQEGVVATKFTGPLEGNADTATTATNLAAASDILAGTVSIDPALVSRTSAAVQTFTLTGLTTDHKIVVTPGTALGYGIVIAAAWASAANTLSVEFHNYTGNQDINLPAKDLQYFAWI